MTHRLPIVGVMGSGVEPWPERAEPLGRWLAGQGVHLLTGGGAGVMTTVTRAFTEVSDRRGVAIGILPGGDPAGASAVGYPNPYVELPILTHLPQAGVRGADPMSRNHITVLSATVIVALPGGPGTSSEVRLASSYGRPVVAFLGSRREIPDLPRAVPVRRDLAGVQAFVIERLRP